MTFFEKLYQRLGTKEVIVQEPFDYMKSSIEENGFPTFIHKSNERYYFATKLYRIAKKVNDSKERTFKREKLIENYGIQLKLKRMKNK